MYERQQQPSYENRFFNSSNPAFERHFVLYCARIYHTLAEATHGPLGDQQVEREAAAAVTRAARLIYKRVTLLNRAWWQQQLGEISVVERSVDEIELWYTKVVNKFEVCKASHRRFVVVDLVDFVNAKARSFIFLKVLDLR